MGKYSVFIGLALVSITGCSMPTVFVPSIPQRPPVQEVRWLEQGWSSDERFWFHHVSQGTSTLPIPYSWFVALEQPELSLLSSPGLLSDPNYLRRYGFIPSPKQIGGRVGSQEAHRTFAGNPDGLPVGFSKLPASPDPVTGQMQPDQLGFTCAACHTGQIEYQGTSFRIDGAPAMTDLGKFRHALGLALSQTNTVPGRFGRFAKRVLGEDHTTEQAAQLQGQLKVLLDKIERLKTITDTVAHQNVEEGFARLDAINRIGTQVFFTDLLGAPGFDARVNLAGNNAPVNFPHIWDTYWFTWVEYDASILQPMFRNAGEALGVGAKINLIDRTQTLYKSAVGVQELHEIEKLLAGKNPHSGTPGFKGLRSPTWPDDILGSIDPGRKERGRALYGELCQSCHLAPVSDAAFWSDPRWQQPNVAGERYLDLVEIPVVEIGTDPGQARLLGERRVTLPSYLGIPGTRNDQKTLVDGTFGQMLAAVVEKATTLWYDEHHISAEDRTRMNGNRPNLLQTKNIYKARPLNGIWATPPFLHNGSVPTMYALLSPVAERPKAFCLGDREYDPVHMGYRTQCTEGTFRLDTSIAGNFNTGHEFKDGLFSKGVLGRGLSHQERLDLIEFLKSQ
ncbi:MAG: di-heme-cytochrome C peroxidase [Nitrospira sp.]